MGIVAAVIVAPLAAPELALSYLANPLAWNLWGVVGVETVVGVPYAGGSSSAPVVSAVASEVRAASLIPRIKPGSAFGPTAGQRFSESVRAAAKAENPTATCVFCQRAGTAKQVDHAIPRARGGNATLDNAQMACEHCNPSKGVGDFPKSPPPGYTGPWPPAPPP